MKFVDVVKVFKQGNSVTVTITKKVREKTPGFEPGAYVRVYTDGKRVLLEPIPKHGEE